MFSSEQLTELLNEPFEAINNDIEKLQRLVQYYQHIYGVESCIGCSGKNKYQQIYSTLKNEGISIMENKENTSFEFNKGVTLVPITFGGNKFITPATLTDELALEFLANNENRISLFAKYPEDWKDHVGAYKQKQAEAGATETVVDPKEEVKKDETTTTETVTTVEEQKQAEAGATEIKTTAKSATNKK